MWAIEDVIALILMGTFFTQVLLPVIFSKRTFPIFRSKTYEERRLRKALEREQRARKLLEVVGHEARAAELEREANVAQERAWSIQTDGLIEPASTTGAKPQREKGNDA